MQTKMGRVDPIDRKALIIAVLLYMLFIYCEVHLYWMGEQTIVRATALVWFPLLLYFSSYLILFFGCIAVGFFDRLYAALDRHL